MPPDYNKGVWTVGAEGVGKDRKIIGVLWVPYDSEKGLYFECGHKVILSRRVKVDRVPILQGSSAIVVDLRDPTLSPKHYNFIGVYFEEQEISAWVSIDDVVDSSQGEVSSLTEFDMNTKKEVPPSSIVH